MYCRDLERRCKGKKTFLFGYNFFYSSQISAMYDEKNVKIVHVFLSECICEQGAMRGQY